MIAEVHGKALKRGSLISWSCHGPGGHVSPLLGVGRGALQWISSSLTSITCDHAAPTTAGCSTSTTFRSGASDASEVPVALDRGNDFNTWTCNGSHAHA